MTSPPFACGVSDDFPNRSRRPAFTLIEMLVATALAAVLMTGVLLAMAGVARDRKAVDAARSVESPDGFDGLMRFDLINARTVAVAADGSVVLSGVGGIDARTLEPDGRLVRVTYRLGRDKSLWREQRALDDPSPAGDWRERVAADVNSFSIGPVSTVPSVVPDRVRLELSTGRMSVDQTVQIR